MYKIGIGIGILMACGAIAMIIKSKRNLKVDITAGVLLIAEIAIAVSAI